MKGSRKKCSKHGILRFMPNSRSKIFLDANVLIAAVLSPRGGSFRLITEAGQKGFYLFSSFYVLDEAIKNLKEDYPDYLASLKPLLLFSGLKILKNPPQKEVAKAMKLIDFKDAPVLTTTLQHKMNFLITLDREHFFTQQLAKADLPCEILTPGDFIKKYLND